MIPQQKIQEILDTAKIEDVIGDFVTLKKAGINYKGLSPFSNEKTPSFIVSPVKQIYKDFSSSKGGNVVSFLMEHESFSFLEALRWLAKRYNIELEEVEMTDEQFEAQKIVDSLYIINEFASQHFQNNIFHSDEGKNIGLSYLKERQFSNETIQKFNLGYASAEGSKLTSAALKSGYKLELLKNLGLSNSYDKDFFKERVMFPIQNISGKVVGFGGRILRKDAKIAKYINSPESEIYNKSKLLYGIYQAKQAIKKNDFCVLVEGYTDVISMHQEGIENVVASSGTALTEQQIRLIKRYTDNVTLLYDGDKAGIKAAIRGLDLLLDQDINVKICLIPDGDDPDSFVRKIGGSGFSEFLQKNAKDFIFFKTNLLLEEAKQDPIAKANLINDIIATISLIKDPIKRAIYIQETSKRFETRESLINNQVNELIKSSIKKSIDEQINQEARLERESNLTPSDQPPKRSIGTGAIDEYQEKDLIRLIMMFGERVMLDDDGETPIKVAQYIAKNILEILEFVDNQLFNYIIKLMLDQLSTDSILPFSYYINHQDEKIKNLALEFVEEEFLYSKNWKEKFNYDLQGQKHPDDNHENDTRKGTQMFKLKKVRRAVLKNQERIKEAEKYGNSNDIDKLLKIHFKLLEIQNELSKQMKRVVY